MGMSSIYYFCSGSLIFSIVYFLYQREWNKMNADNRGMLDNANGSRGPKVLLRKWDSNAFDWWSLFIILCGAAFQVGIYSAIVMTFKVAKMADLNIGISQAIWSVNPFLISILERVVYGTPFEFKQVWGMLCLIACAILVSLSEVFQGKPEDDSAAVIIDDPETKVPVW